MAGCPSRCFPPEDPLHFPPFALREKQQVPLDCSEFQRLIFKECRNKHNILTRWLQCMFPCIHLEKHQPLEFSVGGNVTWSFSSVAKEARDWLWPTYRKLINKVATRWTLQSWLLKYHFFFPTKSYPHSFPAVSNDVACRSPWHRDKKWRVLPLTATKKLSNVTNLVSRPILISFHVLY